MMKKSLVAAGFLIGAAWGVLIWGSGYVNQEKESVELTESVVYGDLAEAEGITFQIDSQWDNKLFWSTKYLIGGSEPPETKFCFRQTETGKQDFWGEMGGMKEEEIVIDLPFIQSTAMAGKDLLSLGETELFYSLLVKEAASRTAAGEVYTEEVYLADYISYYPLYMDVQSSKIPSMRVPEDAQERVNQLIQIPVLPDQKVKISVRKDTNGEVNEIRYENIEGGISVCTSGVVSDSNCYFSFVCYNSEGEVLDRELLKTVYGIYSLPFHWEKAESFYSEDYAVMEYENMECVYPLDTKEGWIVALKEDGERCLLVTKEAEKLMFAVIKKDTKETLQQISLLDWEAGDEFQSLELQGDTLLVSMKSGKICFLVKDKAGLYQEKLHGDFSRIEDRWERENLIRHHTFQWDGERLAVAGFLYGRGQNSVYLTVFKEEGMVFLGYYQHSGDLDWKIGWEYAPIQPSHQPILQMQQRTESNDSEMIEEK